MLKRGSAAVEVFMKWIDACRLVRKVCEQIRKEDKPSKPGGDEGADEEE